MPFGEIFTGAFERIWRHKKLWLFAMIGLALTGAGMLVYLLFAAQWLGGYFTFMSRMMRNPQVMPQAAFSDLMRSMSALWAGLACMGMLSVIGYIVNLIARGAIIGEASRAWRNERTDYRRGLRWGSRRAVYIFLLDLLWWLPAVVLAIGGAIAFVLLIAVSAAASDSNTGGGLIATSWIAFFCCGGCAFLLYYLAFALFSPLMYQSAVAGDRNLGSAVQEGWSLARANLGAMIIFWLLLLLVGFVLYIVQQAVATIFALPLLSSWFGSMGSMLDGFTRGAMPVFPALSGPLLVLSGLVSTILWFLITTFTQTLNLTLYGGVYQHLTGIGPVGPVEPELVPSAPEPAPAAPVAPFLPDDAPIVEPPRPSEPEVPPTL